MVTVCGRVAAVVAVQVYTGMAERKTPSGCRVGSGVITTPGVECRFGEKKPGQVRSVSRGWWWDSKNDLVLCTEVWEESKLP